MKNMVNVMNQNKRRVWLNKSVSLQTPEYFGDTHASLSHIREIQGQKGCGLLSSHRGTQR